MIKQLKHLLIESNKLKSALFTSCFILFTIIAFSQTAPLTQDKFNNELRKTYAQNLYQHADSLISDNRLFVKPFVNGIIKESLTKELKGKTKDSKQLVSVAEKTAKSFEHIFGEKSLTIAVNYLTIWTKEQKEKKLFADSLYALGTKYRLGDEKEKALECLSPALENYILIGDERGEAEVLGGLGAVYFNNYHDYKKALDYYKDALFKREKVDDRQLTGNTLNSLGATYYSYSKDYLQAISYYERAEAIRTETGELAGLRTVQYNKAGAYKAYGDQLNDNGKFHEAIESLKKAYEIDSLINERSEISDVLSLMGFVYSKTGDYTSAIEKLTEAAKIMKEENDSVGLAGVYNHFGIVLQRAGRTEKALEYYKNSLKIYEEKEDSTDEIPVIDNLGTLFFEQKEYAKAEEYHTRGLKICRQLNERKKEVDYLLNLANDQAFLGNPDDARSNYEEGLTLARSLNNPDLIWRLTVGLAENYEQRGDYEKAVALNDSALTIIESLRNTLRNEDLKASFIARERYVFEDLIDLLQTLNEKDPDKGYDKLAFSYAERSKSRVLLDLIGESVSRVNKEADYDRNIRNAELNNPVPVSLDEAKTICRDRNTVILDYSVGDSSSCLWVITGTSDKIFRLPGRKTLQEQVETIRFALTDPSQGISEFFTKAGNLLYEELIRPAEPFLSNRSRLVIIPDGILNYLPFEVLLTENKKPVAKASYLNAPFLIKKFPVSYSQSASVLKTIISQQNGKAKEPVAEGKKLIAFGDPVYEDTLNFKRTKFVRLEYTGSEIEKIAGCFEKGSSEIYLRDNATEENVKKENKLSGFNYIHFATHGITDENKPDQSSIVLTGLKNSNEDGFLRASEIFNLQLNADLVVLSACQTGLGKLVRGEGMVGLTRAFMYAGTPSVLVSLWSVSDMSTADLMGEFYRNLIKNKLSRSEALRKAQLTVMSDKKYSHPFYWAPFVLIGDWR